MADHKKKPASDKKKHDSLTSHEREVLDSLSDNPVPSEVDASTFEKDILDDVGGVFHYQEILPQNKRARKKSLKKMRRKERQMRMAAGEDIEDDDDEDDGSSSAYGTDGTDASDEESSPMIPNSHYHISESPRESKGLVSPGGLSQQQMVKKPSKTTLSSSPKSGSSPPSIVVSHSGAPVSAPIEMKKLEGLSGYAGYSRRKRVALNKNTPAQVDLSVSPVINPNHNFMNEDKYLVDDGNEDRSDNALRVYHYMSRLPVDEDGEHEFKSIIVSHHPVQTIAEYCKKYINAFLNTNGGTIYFGIEDDGTIQGLPINRAGRDDLRLRIDSLVGNYRPQVDAHLYKVDFVPVKFPDFPNSLELALKGMNYTPISEEVLKHKNITYVVQVKVLKGRASVYRDSKGDAYMRMSGSVHKMQPSLIESRIIRGRPVDKIGGTEASDPDAAPRDFCGREAEIMKVKQFVETARCSRRIVVLHGSPLVGKTSLAHHLVEEFRTHYNGKHYVIDMKSTAPEQKYVSVTSAFTAVILQCFPQMTAQLPRSEVELRGLFESCFGEKSSILLIENAGPKSEDVLRLLPRSAHSVLVIITSRRDLQLEEHLFEGVLSLHLTALSHEDAISLIKTLVKDIDDKDAADLAALCGYMPMPIRLASTLLRRKRNFTPKSLVKRLQDENKRLELIEPILTAAVEVADEDLREHLVALSLFPANFDGAAAAAVMGVDYEDAEDHLGELLELNIIDFEQKTGLYSINDLTLLYLRRERSLPAYSAKVPSWMTRFVAHMTDTLDVVLAHLEESNVMGHPSEYAALQLLRRERPNIASAMNYTQQVSDKDVREAFFTVVDEVFKATLPDSRCRKVFSALLGNYVPNTTAHSATDIVVDFIAKTTSNPLFSSMEVGPPPDNVIMQNAVPNTPEKTAKKDDGVPKASPIILASEKPKQPTESTVPQVKKSS